MFAVPMDTVVRIHASSGTTGQPTVVGYTARDVNTWATLMARALAAGGATRGDIIHNAFGYGLFTGGLGVHYGAEKLGASVIPVSGGNTKRQITIMKDFGPTIITATPSYVLHLAEIASELGVDFKDLKFKYGIFGAEPWSENMREEIERKLHLKAVDIYGLSEVIGPGVSIECHEAQRGMHIAEDHFIPEIIDPDTGEPLPYGETGELIFTSITKEAFPVLRYRTRDITAINPEPCICGRTLVRMNKVSGRTDDMLIIRGVNVFPSQIESVLMETEGVEPHYQLQVDRVDNLDQADGDGGGGRASLLGYRKAPSGHRKENHEKHQGNHRRVRAREAGRTQDHPAKRGEGRPGDRQPKVVMAGNFPVYINWLTVSA